MSELERKEPGDSSQRCRRPYRMGQRVATMDETRARIVAAARELILGENALAGFSIELVARQANVTRMTVYNRFVSRRGLLEALFDEVGASGRMHERMHEVFAHPDAKDALRAYVALFCDFWDGERAMHRRLRAFAQLDEEFASAIASRLERHQHAVETLLRRLGSDASPEMEERVQTVMALTSFEFYDVLAGPRDAQEMAPLVLQLVLSALSLDEEPG